MPLDNIASYLSPYSCNNPINAYSFLVFFIFYFFLVVFFVFFFKEIAVHFFCPVPAR